MIKLLKPLAIVAILGFPLAVAGFRLNLFGFGVSAKVIQVTLLLAVAVFFVGMVASFVRRKDRVTAKAALTAATLALIPILALGSQIITARSVPFIHNISTDVENPPAFDKVVALRAPEHNPLEYKAEDLADVQRQAYPNVKTVVVEMPLADAHAKAKSVVESLGWELVNSDSQAGIIEATETTFIWGFKDDVVVRLVEADGTTKVDLRSVSRIGGSDLGANAKRIEKFLSRFADN